MIIRAFLITAHMGAVLGPALVLTAFAPAGTGLRAFPRFVADGGPWVTILLVLALAQAVIGSILGLRNLRVVTPVGVHVIGPTIIAWVGLAGATLGVAAAGDAVVTSSDVLNSWVTSLVTADHARQYSFLIAGWGWLAALANITLGAFARRGGAPRKPGWRLAIIAAACTLPTVVLLIGGDMVALRSGAYLVGLALIAGGLLALAAPTVSVWSNSDDAASRSQAFSTIWLCGCAAVMTVATQGLAMAWQAQSAALAAAVLTDNRAAIAGAGRAQVELSTELAYLSAGLALTWLTLAMRGRRVVLSAPSHNIGSVLVTLLLATSIGVANNIYEHGASRHHAEVLAMDAPVVEGVELPIAQLREPMRLASVVRIDANGLSIGGASLATREDGAWIWRGDAALIPSTVPPATAGWQRQVCGEAGTEIAVAAPGAMTAADLLGALAELRRHGICRVEVLAQPATIPFGEGALSAWVAGVVESRQRKPHGISFFLATESPEGAVVIIVDATDPPETTAGDPIALEWGDITLSQALTLAPAPYAVLLLPAE